MSDPAPIRVLAVDDHPLIRAGLVSFLATEPGLEVVGEAANGETFRHPGLRGIGEGKMEI